MFSVKKINAQGFGKIILADDATGTTAEILPGWGAMLHAFTVLHEGHAVNVIESYYDAADIQENQTAKGFKSSKLSPFVCRIKNAAYHFGGKDHTINKFLLGKNALHGLLYDALFTVSEIFADEEKASIVLIHEYRAADEGYPFTYDCVVNYTLEKNNRLTITTTIKNRSEGLIPVQDGWHPYFTFGKKIDALQLEFQSKEMLEFDDELIPTGKLIPYQESGALEKIGTAVFDNCFTLNFAECQPLCVLRDPEQLLQVEIHPARSYPFLQLYTPDHRNSIAIENLSGAPDGFNNGMGLITLQANEEAIFSTVYKITAL